MQIVAAFTDGDSDNLMVGRNGIFYDRKGRDWDATITKIVDNPISIRQAFWAPYKKAARMIQEQIAKRAAAADEASAAKLAQDGAAKSKLCRQAAPAAAPPAAGGRRPSRLIPGLIAALGVGAAGIGGMVGGIFSGFLNLKGLMPLGRARHHAAHLRPLDVAGLAQAPQTQPRPDPGCQRLGRQRQGQDQCPLRRVAHQRGRAAPRRAAGPG